MLNLLLKEQKKAVIKEYRIRFWIVFCALLLSGEVVALILLVPPYLIAQTRMDILNSGSAGAKVQDLNAETSKLSDVIKQANTYLSALNSSSTPTGVVLAIKNISEVRDKTIQISSFFYKTNNGQQEIVVTGKADLRQSLLDFAKKLKNQPGVVSADLPVSDFTKAQDISFSIKILMNPKSI